MMAVETTAQTIVDLVDLAGLVDLAEGDQECLVNLASTLSSREVILVFNVLVITVVILVFNVLIITVIILVFNVLIITVII